MMVEEIILQGISDFGFPIAAFVLMYTFATKTLKENTKAIQELSVIIKSKLR